MSPSVLDTQRAYRGLLAAMAEPGTVQQLGGGVPLVLATLIDHEVTVAAPSDPSVGTADFLVVTGGSSGGALLRARRGTPLDPAAGATAIYAVSTVGTGPVSLSLTGPGVGPVPRMLSVSGLDATEVELLRQTRVDYPCGVDVVLVDDSGRCAALPRSCTVEAVA
jgi:alpha-D-ribose 1-methylphosphonate 5-triphosphate synthase subunit PhnH